MTSDQPGALVEMRLPGTPSGVTLIWDGPAQVYRAHEQQFASAAELTRAFQDARDDYAAKVDAAREAGRPEPAFIFLIKPGAVRR